MSGLLLPCGVATGIGALPHRDAVQAARFVLDDLPLPAIPNLPRRSAAEGIISQALVGLPGVTLGQYGSVAIDLRAVDPDAPVITDLQHDAFTGFRTFLDEAPNWQTEHGRELSHVKWQFVGPVSFGMALVRAGMPQPLAFAVAAHAVRSRLRHLLDAVAAKLPGVQQVVMLEEPAMSDLLLPGFPLQRDAALDLVSGAMAVIEQRATPGLHVCGGVDVATQLATGPAVLSLAVRRDVLDAAGYIGRFLDGGGHVAWGVVATTGPLTSSVDRPWRHLTGLWNQLVERGVDSTLLRRQSLVTPECGLGMHSPSIAQRVHSVVVEVGRRLQSRAGTRFLGA